MSSDPNTDPVQAMLAQTSLQRSLFSPTSRYYGLATTTFTTAAGDTVTYVKRRLVPQPDRFPDDPAIWRAAGRPHRQSRRPIPWRSDAVLAPVRRQPGDAAVDAHGDGWRNAAHNDAGRHYGKCDMKRCGSAKRGT